MARIELFPHAPAICDGLCVEEDECDDVAVAVVTDEYEIEGTRRFCDAHLFMYLEDVIPLFENLGRAARNRL